MSTTTLTLFAVKEAPGVPVEIRECADMAMMEMNPEGWEELKRKVKDSIGVPGSPARERAQFRELTVELDYDKLETAFAPVDLTVNPATSRQDAEE